MLRSMYAGISGMKNFQTKLDVVGNNIANVNTVGFKKGRVTFQDMMSQTTTGAQGATANRGGINPAQVGLGSQLGSIDNIHTQGFRETTNVPLDIQLEGDGMFVVASNTGRPSGEISAAKSELATAQAELKTAQAALNDAQSDVTQAEAVVAVAQKAFDKAEKDGNADAIAAAQTELDSANEALETAKEASEEAIEEAQTQVTAAQESVQTAKQELNAVMNWSVELDGNAANAASVSYTRAGNFYLDTDGAITNPDGLYLVGFKMEDGVLDTTEHSVITIPTDAESFSIQTDGVVNYVDSNGDPQVAGKIALANFSNPSGLQKSGSNLYLNTPNAGFTGYVEGETEGSASMVAGSLEMSNVDLAEEFAEMIVAQRGFQANTRMITTSDEILQELVNLKR